MIGLGRIHRRAKLFFLWVDEEMSAELQQTGAVPSGYTNARVCDDASRVALIVSYPRGMVWSRSMADRAMAFLDEHAYALKMTPERRARASRHIASPPALGEVDERAAYQNVRSMYRGEFFCTLSSLGYNRGWILQSNVLHLDLS